jgi:uncharacterized phage-like protein YoqJ
MDTRKVVGNMTTVCFTGHRPENLYGYNPSSDGNFKVLNRLRDIIVGHIENKNVDTFITGMALGIDMWAARIVNKLKEDYPHIKLHAAIPCDKQYKKWHQSSIDEWHMIVMKFIMYQTNSILTGVCKKEMNTWSTIRI